MSWQRCGPGDGDSAVGGEAREYLADFDTPDAVLSGASIERRPDAVTLDYLTCFALGPVQQSDPSLGLVERPWAARVEGNDVLIRRSAQSTAEIAAGVPATWEPWEHLFTFEGEPIVEIDLGFDQNGAAYVVAERADGGVWLYWPNPFAGGEFVFERIAEGRSPRIILDDPENAQDSDVLVFYCDDAGVQWLAQRELFATPRAVPNEGWTTVDADVITLAPERTRLQDVALSGGRRLLVIADEHDPESGTYRLLVRESAPYPTRITEGIGVAARADTFRGERVSTPYAAEDGILPRGRMWSLLADALVLEPPMDHEGVLAVARLLSLLAESIVEEYALGDAIAASGRIDSMLRELYQVAYENAAPEGVGLKASIVSLTQEGV